MRIFITGGAGFIGSNLAEFFIQRGDEVCVLDNLSTGRIENLEQVRNHPHFEFIEDTVTNAGLVDQKIAWCDHCYHLAAPVGVKYIMDHPVLTILDNVRGIDVVMESVNRHKKRVLVASTSEVYGKSLDLLDDTGARKLNEEDYLVLGSTQNHRWAYANTKTMDEFLALAYAKEYGAEVVVARFFNTVGPRQLSAFGMVIPNFIKQALANQDIRVFGSGQQKRSFMHVNDVLRAVTGLMLTGKGVGQVFNIGNPIELTINELANKIITKTGSASKLNHISYEEAYGKGFEDMNRRTADITKLRQTLDFEIQYTIDDILDDIIAYHRNQSVTS